LQNHSQPNAAQSGPEAEAATTHDEATEPGDGVVAPGREPHLYFSRLASLAAFWNKINNDWIFNLAGVLAYNFIVTLFPILLLLLGGFGVALGNISPSAQQQFEAAVATLLPGQTGQELVAGIVANLKSSVSLLFLVGFVGAILAGSHLFITLENCFGIIFRLRGRGFLRQNLMAIGMLLLYLIFVLVVFLGSLLPSLLRDVLPNSGHSPIANVLLAIGYPLTALLVTGVAVGMAYVFVPNRPIGWHTLRDSWSGVAVTAALMLLYQAFFPWYTAHFVHVDNYGSVGAFAIIILLFFYYLGLILLFGAEINSWAVGQRETASDLPGMLHAVQAHRSLRGAAGPTAGMPREELQHHGPTRLSRLGAALWRRVQRTSSFRPSQHTQRCWHLLPRGLPPSGDHTRPSRDGDASRSS
jgi:membrane protein